MRIFLAHFFIVFVFFSAASFADQSSISSSGSRVSEICRAGIGLFGRTRPQEKKRERADGDQSSVAAISRESDLVEISPEAQRVALSVRLQLLELIDIKKLESNAWAMGETSKDSGVQLLGITAVQKLIRGSRFVSSVVEGLKREDESVDAYLDQLIEKSIHGESVKVRRQARLTLIGLVRGTLSDSSDRLASLRPHFGTQFDRLLKGDQDWPKNFKGLPAQRLENLSEEESARLRETFIDSSIDASLQHIINWMLP